MSQHSALKQVCSRLSLACLERVCLHSSLVFSWSQCSWSLSHPRLRTVLFSFSSAAIALLLLSVVLLPVLYSRGDSLFVMHKLEGWMFLGALPGLAVVFSGVYFIPYLGISGISIALTSGQMFMSLIMDNYGVLGFQIKPATPLRIAGVICMTAAAILLQVAKLAYQRRHVQSTDSNAENAARTEALGPQETQPLLASTVIK
eukprot:m.681467 g.681467  ORF g.681467 m.681467 type:complete len:202 (+) comp58599_c0_seq8:3063-3668(+)